MIEHENHRLPQQEEGLGRTARLLDAIRTDQSLFIVQRDARPVFESLLDTLVSLTDSEFGFLDEVLYDANGQPYKLSLAISNVAWDAESAKLYEQLAARNLEFRNLRNLAGLPALEKQPVIANDAPGDERAGGVPPGHPVIHAYMGLPLFFGGELVGVAGVANRPDGYSLETAQFLEPFLAACSSIIHAVRAQARERAYLEALRSSEARYRRIVETANEGIWETDDQFRITYVNRQMARMLGYSEAEMLGRKATDFIFPEEQAEQEEQMRRRRSGEAAAYERRFRRKDGEACWAIVAASPVFDEGGNFAGAVAMATDISERRKMETAVQESMAAIQAIFNAVTESVFLMDPAGTVIAANETAARRLGVSSADLAGRCIYDFLPPQVAAGRRQQVEKVVAEKRAVQFEDERSGVWFEHSLYPVFDAGGEVSSLAVFGRDVTERKKAEGELKAAHAELQRLLAESELSRQALMSLWEDQKESEEKIRRLNLELEDRIKERTAQLRAANRELEAFSYSVSHDLRAPLRALEGFSAALLEDCAAQLDERGRGYLARIQEASQRMSSLIHDLLKLSRLSQAELNIEGVDLSELARQVAMELGARYPGRKVQWEIEPGLSAEGDAHLLRIALENLLDNALKFTAHRGLAEIRFGKQRRDGAEAFYVSDNGAGFDMEYASRLFSPFQRLHSEKEFPGTGIGLCIVQRIIARHGGRIWPKSEMERGATFYFTLGKPLA